MAQSFIIKVELCAVTNRSSVCGESFRRNHVQTNIVNQKEKQASIGKLIFEIPAKMLGVTLKLVSDLTDKSNREKAYQFLVAYGEGRIKIFKTKFKSYCTKIDRNRSAQQAIESIRKVHSGGSINDGVVLGIPKNEGLEEEELSVISCKDLLRDGESYLKVVDLPKRLADLGYELVDFYAFSDFVEQNQSIADKFPLVTQWDTNCCAIARLWSGERRLDVDRSDDGWGDDYRFVCRLLRNN
jgi:hypothetical protein